MIHEISLCHSEMKEKTKSAYFTVKQNDYEISPLHSDMKEKTKLAHCTVRQTNS